MGYYSKIERGLKRCAKLKVRITMAVIVSFMISGNILAADIDFTGNANGSGTGISVDNGKISEPNGDSLDLDDGNGGYKKINGIDINITGVDNASSSTTSAITFKGKINYEVNGDIKVVNVAMNNNSKLNNDAIYAGGNHGGTGVSVALGDKDSTVYLASIGNKEKENSKIFDNSTKFLFDINKNGNLSSILSAKGGNGNNSITVEGKQVNLIGNIDFGGNNNGEGNKIKVTIDSKDSFWYGDEVNVNEFQEYLLDILGYNIKKGELDLTLSNGAQWIYNINSTISNIILDGGIINLQDEEIKQIYEDTIIKNVDENGNPVEYKLGDYRSDEKHKQVTINNLKGKGGIFKVDLDWSTNQGNNEATDKSDYIYIKNVEEKGSTQLIDFDSSKANLDKMNKGDKLYFADVTGGGTSFTTIYGDNWTEVNSGNVFDYNYFVDKDSESTEKWYIGLAGKGVGKNGNFKMAKGSMYATYALGTELDTLTKRAGEMRYVEGNEGMWVRYQNKENEWDDIFKTEGQMVQFGYDKLINGDEDKYYLGIAVDYTDTDTTIQDIMGEGENERYSIALYNTWINNDGKYYDLVARIGRINNDYDTKSVFNNGIHNVGSKYHQEFGSVSGEYGINYELADGWYIKPQTQLQLTYIDGAEYVSNTGIEVKEKNMVSLIGRAGFNIGRTYEKSNYYLKADLLHEFIGDKEFRLTGKDGSLSKGYDDEETWVTLGAGTEAAVTESTTVWCDLEHVFGSDTDNTWQVNLGFRYKF